MSATTPSTCPRCDFDLPDDAKFCSRCGKPVFNEETAELPLDPALGQARREKAELPLDPARPVTSIHRTERRALGLTPLPLLGGLALLALLLAIILGAAAGWIPGIGLLLVSALLTGLFITGLHQQPESATARHFSVLSVRLRDLTAFLLTTGRTWGRVGAKVASLRWRRARLERELRRRLTPLGEAVHESDAERIDSLKAEAAELQRRLDESSERESAVLGSARSELKRERVPVRATEVFTPVSDPEAGQRYPEDGPSPPNPSPNEAEASAQREVARR